jgi:hypothetical protein
MNSFKNFFSTSKNDKPKKSKFFYSAVVLDKESRQRLINNPEISKHINPQHDLHAHHMTIKLGDLKNSSHHYRIGKNEKFMATHVGITEDHKVLAVRVNGVSDNSVPHVTITVNTQNGGKAKDSNNITQWVPLKHPIPLSGTVEETYI